MDKMIFQVPAVIVRDKSLASGRQFIVETGENDPEKISILINCEGQPGWFTFSIHQIEVEDIKDLPELKPTDEKKTPAQRLRAVLYRRWEQNDEGMKEFDSFYRYRMEKYIDHEKSKLD